MGIVFNIVLSCVLIGLYVFSITEGRKIQIVQYKIANGNDTATGGVLGPWRTEYAYGHVFSLVYRHDIFITKPGVYQITAQIRFRSSQEPSSFDVIRYRDGEKQKIATCSQLSGNSTIPVTCFTEVVTTFKRGDRVSVEVNRKADKIDPRRGFTYLGFRNIYFTKDILENKTTKPS
jgi:hypothetical protein